MPETFKRNRFIVGGNAGEQRRKKEAYRFSEDINSYQLI